MVKPTTLGLYSSDAVVSLIRTFLNCTPAVEALGCFSANISISAVPSCIERLAVLIAVPHWSNAVAKYWILPAPFLEPAARTFIYSSASKNEAPIWFIIPVSELVASSSDILDAFFNVITERVTASKPSWFCNNVGIFEPTTVYASAIVLNEVWVSFPVAIILYFKASKSLPVAPVIADKLDNASSNSIACFSAVTIAPPTVLAATTAILAGPANFFNESILTPNLEPNASAASVKVLIDEFKPDKLLFGVLPKFLFTWFWICSSSLYLSIADCKSFCICWPIDDFFVAASSCSYAAVKSRTLLFDWFNSLPKLFICWRAAAVSAATDMLTLFLPIMVSIILLLKILQIGHAYF